MPDVQGRHPYIRKTWYYTVAVLRGALAAQIASWLSLFVLLGVMAVSQDRNLLRQDLQECRERMLWIFLPYAALVMGNLALRLVPPPISAAPPASSSSVH